MDAQKTKTDKELLTDWLAEMKGQLDFLWQDANGATDRDLRERKLKQFWDQYRLYRRRKDFLKAME